MIALEETDLLERIAKLADSVKFEISWQEFRTYGVEKNQSFFEGVSFLCKDCQTEFFLSSQLWVK